MRKTEGRLLVHAVGGGDLGFAGTTAPDRLPDLEGDPEATGRDRRPLRKVFEGLAAAGIPVSLIVLLGTTNRDGIIKGRTFASYAEEMRRRLVSETGLCGARFDPDAVSVVRVESPAMRDASMELDRWLADHRLEEILITCGSGAFALSVGALCAALATRNRARILNIDTPHLPYAMDCPEDVDAHLESWLLRYRFWDALAEVDSDNRELWELLAARQAGKTAPATNKAGLSAGQIKKFTEMWPTAQAALFERIGRREAADFGLLRAWFAEQLDRLLQKEADTPTRRRLEKLVEVLRDRDGGKGRQAGHIRMAIQDTKTDTDSAAARMLRDHALIALYTEASTHKAHLMPAQGEAGPLPPTLLEAASRWEKDDPGVKLVAGTGKTLWPVLGSGDVLGLMAVGLEREGKNDQQAIRELLRCLRRRRERLLRPGVLRVRLLASPETSERAHQLARWATTVAPSVDFQVIEGVGGDIDAVHATVTAALASGPPPTGRSGSGSLRDIDEVVVVLNPGPPVTNYGMIAAAVEWSLVAACPLWVTELARRPDGMPELRGGQSVLARLGPDRVLARLASSAAKRLDLRTASRLIERGSDLLSPARHSLEQLQVELYGTVPDTMRRPELLARARRRLLLIAEVGRNCPIPAAYLAVLALRPALFSWEAWGHLRKSHPNLDAVAKLANETLQGHAMDRRGRYAGVRRGPDVPELLEQAARELGTDDSDDALIHSYKAVIDKLEGLYRESG